MLILKRKEWSSIYQNVNIMTIIKIHMDKNQKAFQINDRNSDGK